jgi:hypothetical protein
MNLKKLVTPMKVLALLLVAYGITYHALGINSGDTYLLVGVMASLASLAE